jgi:hypothetical protein
MPACCSSKSRFVDDVLLMPLLEFGVGLADRPPVAQPGEGLVDDRVDEDLLADVFLRLRLQLIERASDLERFIRHAVHRANLLHLVGFFSPAASR